MELKNKSYSVADWSLIVNAILVIVIIILLKGCGDNSSVLSSELSEAKADIQAQEQIILKSYSVIDKLNDSIANIKPEKELVYTKAKHIRDTISVTPDSGQYGITKTLCSISNDSTPFREINYCLEEGNTAKSVLPLVEKELDLSKKKEVKYIEVVASKDTIISIAMNVNDKLADDNLKLNNDLNRETGRKKGWRGLSLGLIILAAIGFAL